MQPCRLPLRLLLVAGAVSSALCKHASYVCANTFIEEDEDAAKDPITGIVGAFAMECACEGVSLPGATLLSLKEARPEGTRREIPFRYSVLENTQSMSAVAHISRPIPKPDHALLGDFDGECGDLRYIVAVGVVILGAVWRMSHAPILGA
ncbi:hypothetical protein FIBSPDRAFT_963344 [Athelia psychrophila]|uniref:Uncharacterized protein n=1 Tax=Athelia psychrophila TaxID=1759441 RepID=A0A165Z2D2_9AGAM|nr:hypothetical protein FIBSPDRAFT_963344 [Fibularhizoctonia sp. CBS 109695]